MRARAIILLVCLAGLASADLKQAISVNPSPPPPPGASSKVPGAGFGIFVPGFSPTTFGPAEQSKLCGTLLAQITGYDVKYVKCSLKVGAPVNTEGVINVGSTQTILGITINGWMYWQSYIGASPSDAINSRDAFLSKLRSGPLIPDGSVFPGAALSNVCSSTYNGVPNPLTGVPVPGIPGATCDMKPKKGNENTVGVFGIDNGRTCRPGGTQGVIVRANPKVFTVAPSLLATFKFGKGVIRGLTPPALGNPGQPSSTQATLSCSSVANPGEPDVYAGLAFITECILVPMVNFVKPNPPTIGGLNPGNRFRLSLASGADYPLAVDTSIASGCGFQGAKNQELITALKTAIQAVNKVDPVTGAISFYVNTGGQAQSFNGPITPIDCQASATPQTFVPGFAVLTNANQELNIEVLTRSSTPGVPQGQDFNTWGSIICEEVPASPEKTRCQLNSAYQISLPNNVDYLVKGGQAFRILLGDDAKVTGCGTPEKDAELLEELKTKLHIARSSIQAGMDGSIRQIEFDVKTYCPGFPQRGYRTSVRSDQPVAIAAEFSVLCDSDQTFYEDNNAVSVARTAIGAGCPACQNKDTQTFVPFTFSTANAGQFCASPSYKTKALNGNPVPAEVAITSGDSCVLVGVDTRNGKPMLTTPLPIGTTASALFNPAAGFNKNTVSLFNSTFFDPVAMDSQWLAPCSTPAIYDPASTDGLKAVTGKINQGACNTQSSFTGPLPEKDTYTSLLFAATFDAPLVSTAPPPSPTPEPTPAPAPGPSSSPTPSGKTCTYKGNYRIRSELCTTRVTGRFIAFSLGPKPANCNSPLLRLRTSKQSRSPRTVFSINATATAGVMPLPTRVVASGRLRSCQATEFVNLAAAMEAPTPRLGGSAWQMKIIPVDPSKSCSTVWIQAVAPPANPYAGKFLGYGTCASQTDFKWMEAGAAKSIVWKLIPAPLL